RDRKQRVRSTLRCGLFSFPRDNLWLLAPLLPEVPVSRRDDPVLRHARREAAWIMLSWATATVVSCLVSYWLGYSTPERHLGPADIRPIFGMPRWFFWGVIVPWAACGAFIVW